MTGLAMNKKQRWENSAVWSFTCQDHQQSPSLMRPETREAVNTRPSFQSIDRDLSLHTWLGDAGRTRNSILKRRGGTIQWSIYSSAAGDWAVSFRLIGVFVCFFVLSPWQIRDLILALPLTSRPTRTTSTRQRAGSDLSDQKRVMPE